MTTVAPDIGSLLRGIQPGRFAAVAIGASTGAPQILEDIIGGLPADLGVPILVAQHLPAKFTPSFAARIDRIGALSAIEAADGMPVYPGTVYIGPGGKHMRVARRPGGRPTIAVSEEPTRLLYKPSADELLGSVAAAYGRASLGVVMSGIGRDGTEGARAIHAAGGLVLTQSAETCVVYGMPRSCVEAGVSNAALTPEGIRRALLRLSPEHHDLALRPTVA